jgi:hypothetical protein
MCELADQMGFLKEMNRRGHSKLMLPEGNIFHCDRFKDKITYSVIDEIGTVILRAKVDTFGQAWDEYLKMKE